MRIMTIAITGMLAVCVAFPAAAAKKRVDWKSMTVSSFISSFEQCEQKAISLGLLHGQTGHTETVIECMGGRPGIGRQSGNQ
jgi:hypothetical protein